MTRTELIKAIAKEMEVPQKTVKKFIDAFENIVVDTVKKWDYVRLKIGKFYKREIPARSVKLPNMNKVIKTKKSNVVAFRAGKIAKKI